MDTLVHGILGAGCFSRAGLAGGRRGTEGKGYLREPTFWLALGFGMAPDLMSIGAGMAVNLWRSGSLWSQAHWDWVMGLYRFSHSLAGMTVVAGVLLAVRRAWLLPFCAWPLHVLCDIPTHGGGSVYATELFWPFGSWGWHGANWWERPWMFWGSWVLAGAVWGAAAAMRLRGGGIFEKHGQNRKNTGETA